jgi:hypothetical protein
MCVFCEENWGPPQPGTIFLGKIFPTDAGDNLRFGGENRSEKTRFDGTNRIWSRVFNALKISFRVW